MIILYIHVAFNHCPPNQTEPGGPHHARTENLKSLFVRNVGSTLALMFELPTGRNP